MQQQTLQDEILVKFPDGSFKMLQGGVFHDQSSTEVSSLPVSSPTPDQNSRLAEEILHTSGMTIDAALRNRALMIVVSCLKGLRTRLQAKDAFMKPPTEGGLGLDATQTESLLKLIKEELHIPAVPLKVAPPPPNLPAITVPPQPPALTKSVPPVLSAPLSITQSKSRVEDTVKPRFVIDVRPPVKLVSPSEELSMSLVDFRRISSNSHETVKSILEKIATLEAQSFTKKLDGITAWQQSEVVATYAAIIEASIGGHASYEEVINQRKKDGVPTLSKEEFLAVIELNKQLRF